MTSASLFVALLLLALLLSPMLAMVAEGTTLTYKLLANEKACFYTWNAEVGKKVAFYFAVQSGGDFDVDYTVTDPVGKVLLSGTKERQGDFVYNVKTVGEHAHCLSNTMSTFTEKLVDFELTAQDDKFSVQAKLPQFTQPLPTDHLTPLEEALYKISADLSAISRNQKYFRTRENRNFETVEATEASIFWFALGESVLILGMAFLQVFVVRTFFKNTGQLKARI